MITFVTALKDSYDSVHESVSIVYSDAIRLGDLLIAAIVEPRGDLATVTPPIGWTRLRNIRALNAANTGVGVTIYYRFAEAEPTRWVWSFSGQPAGLFCGIVGVYRGVDYHAPLDVTGSATGTAGITTTAPAVTTSGPNAMLVTFFAANTSSAFTSSNSTVRTSRVSPAITDGSTIQVSAALADAAQDAAGDSAAISGTITSGVASTWVAAVIALRPDRTTVTADEAKRSIENLYPPGSSDLWDFDSAAANVYKKGLADAEFLKRYGFDLRDAMEREAVPNRAVLKLPEWENALGISQGTASQRGGESTARRQTLVTERLRESGAPTKHKIRAALEPLLGYERTSNSGTLVILETNRYKLREAHTRSDGTSVTIAAPSGETTKTIAVADDGYVSAAGVQLDVQITAANPESIIFDLTGPAAAASIAQTGTITTTAASTLVTGSSTRFTAVLYAGAQITGDGGGTWHTVDTIQNDTLLTLAQTSGQNLTSAAYSSRRGQAAAFWDSRLPAGAVTRQWFRLTEVTRAARRVINGNWSLRVQTGLATATSLHHARLFVEGSGRDSVGNSGLGSAIHYWCIVVEEGKLPAGFTPDYVALLKAIDRLTPAHAVGFYCRVPTTVARYGYGAIPSATVTSPYAVPGLCLPSFGSFMPWASPSLDVANDVAIAARQAQDGRSRKHPATDGWLAYVRV